MANCHSGFVTESDFWFRISGFVSQRRWFIRADQENAVLSALLRIEHQRAVGGVDQFLGVVCIVRINRKAAADGECALTGRTENLEIWRADKPAEAITHGANGLRYAAGASRRGLMRLARLAGAFLFPEDNRELVAAD